MSMRKTGKGKGKHFETVADNKMKQEQLEDARFPHAVKKGTKVLAVMRNGTEYKLAEILDVRKAKNPNEDEFAYLNQDEESKARMQVNPEDTK
jgi:hypothetical protein